MRLLGIQLILVLICHWGSAAELESQALVTKSTGKACPGCGGSDCTNTTFAFGIPILQLIGGVAAGLIWAGIFIWIYVWVDQGPGGGGGIGGFGEAGIASRNDDRPVLPPEGYDTNYADYQPLPTANMYSHSKTKRGGNLKSLRTGGLALPDKLDKLSGNVISSVRSTF